MPRATKENRTITEKLVKEAILVILDDTSKHSTVLNWAVNYCRMAMVLHGTMLRSQCLYILGSLVHWRHPKAKDVRHILKTYVRGGE